MTTKWIIGIDWDRDGAYTDETARVMSAKWIARFPAGVIGCGQ